MSSKVNSSSRTSSASSASVLASSSSTLRSVRAVGVVEDVGERLDAAGGRVLLRDHVGELLAHHVLDLRDDLGARLGHLARRGAATSACSSGSRQREHLGGQRGVQVGDHERDRLRRLVAQEDVDLLRRRAAQELERPALDRRRQAADDLLRACWRRASARGCCARSRRRPRRCSPRRARSRPPRRGRRAQTSVGTLRDLAISSESASTSLSPRWRKISLARSSPMATSRTAAFSIPFRLAAVMVSAPGGWQARRPSR